MNFQSLRVNISVRSTRSSAYLPPPAPSRSAPMSTWSSAASGASGASGTGSSFFCAAAFFCAVAKIERGAPTPLKPRSNEKLQLRSSASDSR